MNIDARHQLPRIARAAMAVVALSLILGLTSSVAAAADTPIDSAPGAATDAPAAGSSLEGVELGEFQVRTYYPVEAQKSDVSFTLYATVKSDEAAKFEQLLENRRHKVRDEVIIATRLVPLADFNDPGLEAFRRRVLLRLRRSLPELEIQDAYLSDFELTVEAQQ